MFYELICIIFDSVKQLLKVENVKDKKIKEQKGKIKDKVSILKDVAKNLQFLHASLYTCTFSIKYLRLLKNNLKVKT